MYEPDSVWEFDTADRLKFGTEAAAELPEAVTSRGGESVLLLTDEGVEAAGVLEHLIVRFDGTGVDVSVFADVEPDPSVDVFEAAVDRVRAVDPDVVVGVGGGSTLDVTKTTSVLATADGDVLDYVAEPTGGGRPVPGPGLPAIGLPTTAGTGSETTPVSVISLPDRDMKVGISSRHQYLDLAVVDPELTVSLPPAPTATSGIDALSHAVEAYVTRRYDAKERPETAAERPDYGGRTPLTDQLALTAVERIGGSLRQAVDNGQDLAARRDMALGSMTAGMAFGNAGLGATHALAMAIGAEYHLPHGATIAACLPAVMRYNAPGAAGRSRDGAEAHGIDTAGLDDRSAADRAVEAVTTLVEDVGLGSGLASLGVDRSDAERLAKKSARLERLTVGNPRRVDVDDLETLVRESL
jgi:alcohol dehydrogenase class IV